MTRSGDKTPDFRPMSEAEGRLLSALLDADFPGKGDLLHQARRATVRRIDQDGSLEFSVTDGPVAQVVRRIPVEAELDDVDGVGIHVLLHVLDGLLNELEIYRDDSAPVQRLLAAEDLRVLVL